MMAHPISPRPRNAYVDRAGPARIRATAETREQIAADLQREAARLVQEAEDVADERSRPLLEAQADALRDAAHQILVAIDARGQEFLAWGRDYHLRRMGGALRALMVDRMGSEHA